MPDPPAFTSQVLGYRRESPSPANVEIIYKISGILFFIQSSTSGVYVLFLTQHNYTSLILGTQ